MAEKAAFCIAKVNAKKKCKPDVAKVKALVAAANVHEWDPETWDGNIWDDDYDVVDQPDLNPPSFQAKPVVRRKLCGDAHGPEAPNVLLQSSKHLSAEEFLQNYAGPGDVECDACTEKKFRAVKSCLTCPASYCQTHLQPHFEIAAWKDHKLVDPDGNLKEKLCEKHQKSLEIFCETDDACICTMCGVTEHNGHKMVKLEMEREDKEIYVERDVEENEKSFTDLIGCIEEADRKLTEKIKEQEKRETEKTEGPQSRDDFLKYFCPLTLDFNTANRDLCLFEGNKKVTRLGTKSEYPDHPDRFERWRQVLCREALTGTRSYWEVECSGRFMRIGVAHKGLSRKGWGRECRLGNNNKSWCLRCSHSKYSVHHNDKETVISAPYSPTIGVYLDWPAGSLSFYSVSHTMTLLHRFNTSFTEPLYPGFWLGPYSSITISHLTPCDH
ncbi:tripartite motif-containing protein 16-like [Polypterus senegalus]|uniref:tripartite motif-containing protein 16-like n=1 Tax=Polypterus senegalus TaxID=55291 RepID=UPI001962DE9A|nr:tripartite motif-containing protein 16-like [Polypterus senegalus]